MDERVLVAVRNNAEWCDLMCRAHGEPTAWLEGAWQCLGTPPPFYPQGVTLSPGLTLDTFPSLPSGFKDSFADVEPDEGYRKLLDGHWMWRTAGADHETVLEWRVERNPGPWELAWRVGEPSDFVQFPPSLLTNPEVAILGAYRDGSMVAGAILNRSAEVCGVSNVFSSPDLEATVWHDLPIVARQRFGAVPLVGWEQNPASAVEAGFEVAGPLRVWVR